MSELPKMAPGSSERAPEGSPEFTAQELDCLASCVPHLLQRGTEIAQAFYTELFLRAPEVRRLFPHDIAAQEQKLTLALMTLARGAGQFGELRPSLEDLGRRHRDYGAEREHYDLVAEVLLETLAGIFGGLWTRLHRGVWTHLYWATVEIMTEAAFPRGVGPASSPSGGVGRPESHSWQESSAVEEDPT